MPRRVKCLQTERNLQDEWGVCETENEKLGIAAREKRL